MISKYFIMFNASWKNHFENQDYSLLFPLFDKCIQCKYMYVNLFLSINNKLCCKSYQHEMQQNENLTGLLYLETQRQTLPELTG